MHHLRNSNITVFLEKGLFNVPKIGNFLSLTSSVNVDERRQALVYRCIYYLFCFLQGTRIVVTGHSLGAGTAAILSILLKEKYNDVHCFAYAPPGGLLWLVNYSHFSSVYLFLLCDYLKVQSRAVISDTFIRVIKCQ